jgi:uncharacterized hydrophobic protein (TIGR00341 family)
MALRLIELILRPRQGKELRVLLKDMEVVECQEIRLSKQEVLLRILLDAEQAEGVLDQLKKHFSFEKGRIVILPVEAVLPGPQAEQTLKPPPERISREELYEDIKDAARCTRVYIAMVLISTIVASVGLHYNSVTVIIGAMVIAPSIGPSMALALGTTLGDLPLLKQAIRTNLIGIALSMILALIIGLFIPIPLLHEVLSRTHVGMGDIAVGLASGAAGALSFTTGVSSTLIGVVVAVALLPPLVTFGLLLGNGQLDLSFGALSFFLMNLICVNLAGVVTFLVQGIHPATWWEQDRAVKATWIAILLWGIMLAALTCLILLHPL